MLQNNSYFRIVPFFVIQCVLCMGSCMGEKIDDATLRKVLRSPPPRWMERQIVNDLSYYREHSSSLSELHAAFDNGEYQNLLLVRFTIRNNQVSVGKHFWGDVSHQRVAPIHNALQHLCKLTWMPDTIFYVSVHDGLLPGNEFPYRFPLFVMSKHEESKQPGILFPDYEALGRKYQVIPSASVASYTVPWKEKKAYLQWRGSTAQLPGVKMTPDTLDLFTRVILCKLSQQFPEKIDAKFTVYFFEAGFIPELLAMKGEWISFQEQFNCKYHILLDGLTAPFSNSGWKFFTKSLIFKPFSPWVQWYFGALKPYVHYVPVGAYLEDLMQKLSWAEQKDREAFKMAVKARLFAKTHLLYRHHLAYLYELIQRYAKLYPLKETHQSTVKSS